ncbi:MAG: GGDEF domain-containing protein [Deltaproteobacteria bacterium HGW-Deltaproteobacteria-1]|jgi:diguanylate cyclase (GGDEF)-like protein|nr:MAG: GGDEF domain-containing protein [Deltaproteobacteria bacterium HGW-Deltaproteobacteria-1]
MNNKDGNHAAFNGTSCFSFIPKDNPNQALRIRRLFMASVAYVLNGSLAYFSYLAGITEWPGVAGLLIIIPAVNITFYLLIRTGFNLRFADPSMTFAQMCAATLTVMYVMYYANESRGLLLLMYVIMLLFGIFRLNTRDFFLISMITLMTYGTDIILLYLFRPEGVNFHNEFLQWIVLAIVMIAFSYIGGYISSLRRNLSTSRSELKKTVENLNISRAELEKSLSIIQEIAIRDELTGLYNRRHLMELLDNEKNRSLRGNTVFTIAMLDIDHFKKVNDTHGHQSGDEVLRTVSAAIHNTMRNTDFCGRYGGEEFVLVLIQTDLKEAMICAERMRANIEKCRFPRIGDGFRITASIGLSEYQLREEIETMIARADRALYRAKEDGRNRVACET